MLRTSPLLQEKIPDAVRPQQLPVFVKGDHISGQTDLNALIEGNAELRRGDTVIRADRLDYNVPEDLAKANGKVRINRAGNVYEGTALELRVDAFEGFFSDARYRFLATQAHGDATRVDFVDRYRAVVHNATYTTCERGNEESWEPDWVLRAGTHAPGQRRRSGHGRGRGAGVQGHLGAAHSVHHLPAVGQAQVGPAAAHHRPRQPRRRGLYPALLLEHRPQPRCHACAPRS